MVRPDICYEGLVSSIHGTSHVESRWAGSPSVHFLYFNIVSLSMCGFNWDEILLVLVTVIFTKAVLNACSCWCFNATIDSDYESFFAVDTPSCLLTMPAMLVSLGYTGCQQQKKVRKSLSDHWGSDPLNVSATPFITQSSYSDKYQACSSRVFSSPIVQKSSRKLFHRENRKQHPRWMILIWLPNVLDNHIKYT